LLPICSIQKTRFPALGGSSLSYFLRALLLHDLLCTKGGVRNLVQSAYNGRYDPEGKHVPCNPQCHTTRTRAITVAGLMIFFAHHTSTAILTLETMPRAPFAYRLLRRGLGAFLLLLAYCKAVRPFSRRCAQHWCPVANHRRRASDGTKGVMMDAAPVMRSHTCSLNTEIFRTFNDSERRLARTNW